MALCLSHTSVKHSPSPGNLLTREFVAVRRVHLHPSVAATLRTTDLVADRHPWLNADDITWVKAGTQTVDGYWQTLRKRGAHRGMNTGLQDALRNAVLVHQWSYLAGPSADLLVELGLLLQQRRQRRAARDHAVDLESGGSDEDRRAQLQRQARHRKALGAAGVFSANREAARARAAVQIALGEAEEDEPEEQQAPPTPQFFADVDDGDAIPDAADRPPLRRLRRLREPEGRYSHGRLRRSNGEPVRTTRNWHLIANLQVERAMAAGGDEVHHSPMEL